jgi:hypothetical protein
VTPDEVRSRFESHVDRTAGPDACHPWTAACDRDGYGALKIHRKSYRANRVAFFLAHGVWPDVARHTCDTPPCCNATHIVDGTTLENQRDRKRNRTDPTGARNPNAVLTEDDVRAIRTSASSGASLAGFYGVQRSAISKIRTRRTWRHV